MKAKHSISRVYRTIALILIPTVFLAFFFSLYIRNKMSEQAVYLFSSRVNSAISEQNKKLTSINNLLLGELFNNEDIRNLKNNEGVLNTTIQRIRRDFSDYSGYFGGIYEFFLYDREKDLFLTSSDYLDYNTPALSESLKEIIKERDPEEVSGQKWDVMAYAEGEYIIYNAYYSEGILIGSFISLEEFYNQFSVNTENGQEYMFLIRNDTFIDPRQVEIYERITHHADMVVRNNDDVYRNLTYWVRKKSMPQAEFDSIFAANVMGGYGWAQALIFSLLFLDIIVLAVGVGMLHYVQKRLVRPLNRFIDKFSQDETKNTPDESPVAFEEIQQVNSLFERAERQIETLKIEVYEKELEQQKMELSFLQSQVHPHFYLNNMSVFYGMAEAGRTKEIQQLSMEIAEYFRFLLRDGTKLVRLSQELDHVQRYLNIYQIRYEDELNYTVKYVEGIEGALVPPLMILTLVENSFKYARQADQVLTISVKIEKIDKSNKEFLEIIISDNGPGFPKKILEDLENGVTIESRDGYGIGLTNTIRRIQYFYPGQGRVNFSNGKYEGAIVRLTIPYET